MTTLTLALANAIIEHALARSHELGYRPMAVAVIDDGGNLKALQRDDGASMLRADIAVGKAWAAVGMGTSSRTLVQRAKDLPAFYNALAATGHGKFIPQTGAVLIQDEHGRTLGAVGASGGTGEEDETICMHGVQSAGLRCG
jgi:uncharacterized protein GlcG (DUF336 family)